MPSLKAAMIALVSFAVLDACWFGFAAKGFYRTQLASFGRMADGGLDPIWPAAMLVYVLLAIGAAVLIVPRVPNAAAAAKLGAVFGLVVYGVYDLTNYALIKGYTLPLTIVDVCWGIFASAVASAITRALV
jgi:uncharacterized membrane protein